MRKFGWSAGCCCRSWQPPVLSEQTVQGGAWLPGLTDVALVEPLSDGVAARLLACTSRRAGTCDRWCWYWMARDGRMPARIGSTRAVMRAVARRERWRCSCMCETGVHEPSRESVSRQRATLVLSS